MRCKICNSSIDNPKWNVELDDWEVCQECLEVIFSVFEDYPENKDEDGNSEESLVDVDTHLYPSVTTSGLNGEEEDFNLSASKRVHPST